MSDEKFVQNFLFVFALVPDHVCIAEIASLMRQDLLYIEWDLHPGRDR